MRIKSSNLRTQSFDPEDEAPLPAGAPLPPVLNRGVSRLSDLQACNGASAGFCRQQLAVAHVLVTLCNPPTIRHFVGQHVRYTLAAPADLTTHKPS